MRKTPLFLVFLFMQTFSYTQSLNELVKTDKPDKDEIYIKYNVQDKQFYYIDNSDSSHLLKNNTSIKYNSKIQLIVDDVNLYNYKLKIKLGTSTYFSSTQTLLNNILTPSTIPFAPGIPSAISSAAETILKSASDETSISEGATDRGLDWSSTIGQMYAYNYSTYSNNTTDTQQIDDASENTSSLSLTSKEIKKLRNQIKTLEGKVKIMDDEINLLKSKIIKNNKTIAENGKKIIELTNNYYDKRDTLLKISLYLQSSNFTGNTGSLKSLIPNRNVEQLIDEYNLLVDTLKIIQNRIELLNIGTNKDYIKFISDIADNVISDYDSHRNHLMMLYNLSDDNSFKYTTGFNYVQGDDFTITIKTEGIPAISNTSVLNTGPFHNDSASISMVVIGEWKVSLSGGIFSTFLTNEIYANKSVIIQNGVDSLGDPVFESKYQVVPESNSAVTFGPAAFIHYATKFSKVAGGGFTFGTGLTIEQSPQVNFIGGLSFMIGQKSRLILNFLWVTGPVQRLSNAVDLETYYDASITSLTYRKYDSNFGFGLSYNIYGLK